ncbi:hypothetical protein [Streptomyces sp. NRRL F-2664]|uniref:hypothetical protein n=1 Tax=Streptomyces sp. NRRL F-2664 TaxID=1463842 RepID=UPI0004CA19D6|nr:hypothetical protein [Streptomyces sp. NRRL F-2664]
MVSRQGVARVYTSARRHPWVLGRLGDWTVPFGPYTPAQLVVLGGGAFALVKAYAWWSWAGPVPVVLWIASVWAVRGAQIAGQNPFTALLGVLVLLIRHPAGRVGGRVARERRPSYLRCRFTLASAVEPLVPTVVSEAPSVVPAAAVTPLPVAAAVGSGLSRLLAGAGQGVA